MHRKFEDAPILVDYTNWRKERRTRSITPIELWYGSDAHHTDGDQWFVSAIDDETGSVKNFALKGFHGFDIPAPSTAAIDQASQEQHAQAEFEGGGAFNAGGRD